MKPVIDGQKQPRPEPMKPLELHLREVRDVCEIAKPEAIEIPISALLEDSDWPTTLRMDLTDLKG